MHFQGIDRESTQCECVWHSLWFWVSPEAVCCCCFVVVAVVVYALLIGSDVIVAFFTSRKSNRNTKNVLRSPSHCRVDLIYLIFLLLCFSFILSYSNVSCTFVSISFPFSFPFQPFVVPLAVFLLLLSFFCFVFKPGRCCFLCGMRRAIHKPGMTSLLYKITGNWLFPR